MPLDEIETGSVSAETVTEGPSNAEDTESMETAIHPIHQCINTFCLKASDHAYATKVSIPNIIRARKAMLEELKSQLELSRKLIDEESGNTKQIAIKTILEVQRKMEPLKHSETQTVVINGIFLSLFSIFDAYTGELIFALYKMRPDLFKNLNRQICFSELILATSIDDLKHAIISDEIEQFKRKSYAEQFAYLENRFDIRLTVFPNWAKFIECAQRRNLITHCNGIVSKQYIDNCKESGIPCGELPSVGSTISVDLKYLITSCELLLEVGFKLGQTLWRKTLPDDISAADTQLNHLLYNSLHAKNYKRAQMIGEFGIGQRKVSDENMKKIITINYIQSLVFSGKIDLGLTELSKIDWSSSAIQFLLAEAVLRKNYKLSSEIMIEIGNNNKKVLELAYHEWPLFCEFRETPEFLESYKSVFGYDFANKVSKDTKSIDPPQSKEIDKELLEPNISSIQACCESGSNSSD